MHIKDAGDWTGALHAKFRASMQLTHSDKRALLQSLKSSLAKRLSKVGEHAGRLQAIAIPAMQVILVVELAKVCSSCVCLRMPSVIGT